ncbi:lipopolysaccharide biosynthesis protein [Streptococcus suis]|uniref:lipopolysaccharide biosynthesis protein n=1 Tax=Streptococcus suis TaxID=1307 RepID=UPI00177E0B10|nr:polysaccharide biosynthesis C-terminal domain-containing protein [Streptococcus suis]QOZ88497.1 sugar lyase [Streptococcus suis]
MIKKLTTKVVFKNTIIYMVCGLLIRGFSFFLLPLYTSYLTTVDYGITSLVSSFLITGSFLVAASLYSAIFRFYVDLKHDPVRLSRFYGTIILFVLLISIIASIVMILGKKIVGYYFFNNIDFFPTIFISILSLVFYCQYTIYENILKSQQQAGKYAIITLIFFILTLVLNILFVVHFKLGANGVLLANLITYAVYFFVMLIDLWKSSMIIWCLDKRLLKEALLYSIPIIPHNLSTHITVFLSKLFIGDIGNLGDVGLFAIASQFGGIADIVQGYVNSAYGPWLYEQMTILNDSVRKNIAKISEILTYVIGFFLLGIALFSHDYIILLLDKGYASSWKYIPLIVSVFLIKILYYFYVEILFYHKKASRLIFVATLSSSLVNVVISYYLIGILGITGSILADFISMLIRVGIVIAISKRFEDIGLKLSKLVYIIMVVVVFMGIGLYFTYLNYPFTFSYIEFGYRVVVMFTYLGFVLYKFRAEFKQFLNQKKNLLGGKNG